MKRIIIFLSILLSLQACKKDTQVNTPVDSLNVTLSGDLADKGSYFDAGDGNWGLQINPDFGGTIKLDIQTDQSWEITIDYITPQQEWVLPVDSAGKGKANVEIDIATNPLAEYRKAIVTVRSQGEIPVEKQITIVQKNQGVLEVNWDHLLTDEEMVFGPNERDNLLIGRYDSKGDEVRVTSTEEWAVITAIDGEVKLKLSKFAGANDSRTTTLKLVNQNGGVTKTIELTQYSSEDISEKSTWTISAGNDKTTATSGEPFTRMIDGNINSHWQWNWPDGGSSDFPNTPYEFVIDLGTPQLFNTFSVWQTQSATNGYVKDVQFKVSDNNDQWIDLGVFRMANSSEEAMAQRPNPNTFTLPAAYKKRYIRLIILSNVGDSKVNSVKNAYLGEFSAFLK